jgi:sporadic carbohydrate cluster protein (TIGR04323 family)
VQRPNWVCQFSTHKKLHQMVDENSVPQKATKAYTTPRSFGGFQIPITLQSTTLRNYCEKNNLIFHLHVVENQIPNTYLVLEALVEKANQYDGIAMCSVSMLPNDRVHRRLIVKRILEQGCALHFTFEQIVISSVEQTAELEELISLIELSPHHGAGSSLSLTNLL